MPPPPLVTADVVHYQMTPQQILGQWMRLHAFRPGKIVPFVVLLFCGFILLLTQGPGAFYGWVCLAAPFVMTAFLYRAFKRIIAQRPEMTEPRSISFDQSGVVITSSTTRLEYAWSRFRKFTENKDHYHLHIDTLGTAATVPKAAFTPGQRDQFLSFTRAIATR